MFRNMLHSAVLAGAVTFAFGLPAMAAMPQTEGDYIPKRPVAIDNIGGVHHGPIDCVTAGKIIRHQGFRDVQARDCNGDVYHFSARRNGRIVHLRIDRTEGNVTRG
jgi:hypothetical protein